MIYLHYYETRLGTIGIGEKDGAIHCILFKRILPDDTVTEEETPLIKETAAEIEEYFDGKRTSFDLPMAPEGTPFQQEVWNALRAIPFGETRSYQEIAESIGRPKAFRAVGMANNKNPIPLLIPCHRVIGKNGSLTGYGGGMELKEKLLELEQKKDG